jgi:hypothetical protein
VWLICGDAARYVPSAGLSQFCHLRRKYSDIPPDKLRHWITDWPLPERKRPPLSPSGTVENWRDKLGAWPELQAAYRDRELQTRPAMLVQYLVAGDPARRDQLLKETSDLLDTLVGEVLHRDAPQLSG